MVRGRRTRADSPLSIGLQATATNFLPAQVLRTELTLKAPLCAGTESLCKDCVTAYLRLHGCSRAKKHILIVKKQ